MSTYFNGFLSDLPFIDTANVHEYCGYICVFDKFERVRGILLFHDKDIAYSNIYRKSNYGHGPLSPICLNKYAFRNSFYRGSLYVRIPDLDFDYLYEELYFMRFGHTPKGVDNIG